MKGKAKYKDIKFFLFFIAFISAFNYYLTYNNIKFNWFLIITYTIDTIQGWLAWWAVRSIIIYLDEKMPYIQHFTKRIIVQLLLTTLVGLLIIILLTELVSWIARGRSAPLNFYTFDIFIFIIWFFVLNGIYISIHYYQEWNESELHRQKEKKLKTSGFSVKHGKQNLLIPFDDILSFYSEEGSTYLHTWQGKKFLSEHSLDKTESLIPKELFFRLNRQYVFHRNALTGFKRVGNGKLEVQVKSFGNVPPTIPVSRIRAVQFKKWFLPEENQAT
jgi:DNA-binding LytR/AlgR family response regulator